MSDIRHWSVVRLLMMMRYDVIMARWLGISQHSTTFPGDVYDIEF
jgi:hypothetical protein